MHLQQDDAPVHYVENTLLCSLFGLLCWEAIFAPLPGSFFTRSTVARWTCTARTFMRAANTCSNAVYCNLNNPTTGN